MIKIDQAFVKLVLKIWNTVKREIESWVGSSHALFVKITIFNSLRRTVSVEKLTLMSRQDVTLNLEIFTEGNYSSGLAVNVVS